MRWLRRLVQGWYIGLPALAMSWVALRQLSQRRLWFDELASYFAASLPFSDGLRLFARVDAVLAPYYWLLKAFVLRFSDSASALRLPSAIAMILSAVLIGVMGRKLACASTGAIAGLIFAVTPSIGRYSQEVRPYALALACAVLATLLLVAAVEKPAFVRRWITYSVSIFAIGIWHLPALALLAPHGVWVATSASISRERALRETLVRRWMASVATALFVLSPLIILGFSQAQQIAWNRANWGVFWDYPTRFFQDRRTAIAVVVLSAIGISRRDRFAWLLLLWAILPLVLFFVTRHQLHLFHPRYLLFTLPAWALLAALGIEQVGEALRVRYLAIGLTTLLLLFIALRSKPKTSNSNEVGYSEAANWIRLSQQDGDAIAFGGNWRTVRDGRLAIAYELRQSKPLDVFVTAGWATSANYSAKEDCNSLSCLPTQPERIWYITSATEEAPWEGIPAERSKLFAANYAVHERRKLRGVSVLLLERKQDVNR